MRIVFMGTPEFASDILESIADSVEVVCVYTRPDAVRGRGKKLVASPVKETALRLGLEVKEPVSLRDADVQSELASLAPDVIVVAAYGAILPPAVLSIPPLGCLNVHASLLPRWRGAAPIERAILAGDDEVGVCIMRMEEGLDTGDYCVRRAIPISDMDSKKLTEELASLGASALMCALAQVEANNAFWVSQDESLVTYANKIEKGELDADPSISAIENIRRIRASSHAHPSKCVIADREVTLLGAGVVDATSAKDSDFPKLASGDAIFWHKQLLLMCADEPIRITEVKPAGKSAMDSRAFAAGLGILRDGAKWRAPDA